MLPVQKVIGRHQRVRLGFAHTDSEAPQINLSHRPLAHLTVARVAVRLLIVDTEVLDRRTASRMLLHAVRDGGREPPAHQRILRVVLEIPPAEDMPVNVERGRQPELNTETLHLIPDDIPAKCRKIRVPALRDRRADRNRGSELIPDFLSPLRPVREEGLHRPAGRAGEVLQHGFRHRAAQRMSSIRAAHKMTRETESGRAVRHHQRSDPDILKRPGRLAGGACH